MDSRKIIDMTMNKAADKAADKTVVKTTNKTADKTSDPDQGHILLVDDEGFLVNLWRRVLEKHGYRVICSSDALNALEIFRDSPGNYDIVVTDQNMPGITGCELATEYFKIRNDVKVILITGYPENPESEYASCHGVCEVLYKPFNNDTLIRAIERNIG